MFIPIGVIFPFVILLIILAAWIIRLSDQKAHLKHLVNELEDSEEHKEDAGGEG